MLIWGIVFLILSCVGTYFGLLDGKTDLESENKGGSLLLLSIVITKIIIATFVS